jgi:hypothetical protein
VVPMWTLAACTPAPPPPPPLELDAAERVLAGDDDQHHVTAGFLDDGAAVLALRAAAWVVTVPLSDGRTLGAPTWPLGDAKANHPQLLARGDDLLLAATRPRTDGLWLAALGPGGDAARSVVLAPGEQAMFPDLAAGDGGGVLVWAGARGLEGWRFGADPLAGERLPTVPAGLDEVGTPSVRAADHTLLLSWAERGAGRSELRTARLDPAGRLSAPEVVDGWPEVDDDARPTLAAGPSGSVLAWRRRTDGEAWLSFRDLDGRERVRRPLHGDRAAGRPALDAVGDVVFATWERATPGGWGVALQPFDLATGDPLADAVTVADVTVGPGRPTVAARADGRSGLVAWEVGDRIPRQVWVRGFRANGLQGRPEAP